MASAVCTLFENHYHYGVAALTNSLYQQGYRGAIYAGYRGAFPDWAARAEENRDLAWPGARSFEAAEGLYIHFLPLDTDYHLTNYKAEFMLRLWDGPAADAGAIAYFDPDIVIKCRWQFYENWMSHGVALVHEIVSNDMPATHPIRLEWEKVIEKSNRRPTRVLQSYINGGFCGISKKNIEFVKVWADMINIAIKYYNADPKRFSSFDRTYPFWSIDQDAINITAMCSESPISLMGPEGMDFIGGGWTMSHATGTPKPWKKNFIMAAALNAHRPTLAEKLFWMNAENPIKLFNPLHVKSKRTSIKVASFISRFYSR